MKNDEKDPITYKHDLLVRVLLRVFLCPFGYVGHTYWSSPSSNRDIIVHMTYIQILELL